MASTGLLKTPSVTRVAGSESSRCAADFGYALCCHAPPLRVDLSQRLSETPTRRRGSSQTVTYSFCARFSRLYSSWLGLDPSGGQTRCLVLDDRGHHAPWARLRHQDLDRLQPRRDVFVVCRHTHPARSCAYPGASLAARRATVATTKGSAPSSAQVPLRSRSARRSSRTPHSGSSARGTSMTLRTN